MTILYTSKGSSVNAAISCDHPSAHYLCHASPSSMTVRCQLDTPEYGPRGFSCSQLLTLTEPLIGPVGQFEDLVQKEGEHVEKEEVV
jgi:hypothetical protein